MRFRGTLADTLLLSQILQCLSHLADLTLLHLSPTHFRFLVPTELTDGERAYFDAPVALLFDDYRIESKSNNEIVMLMSIANLQRAIDTAATTESVRIKLTRKNARAFLSFDGAAANITSQHTVSPTAILLTHDVPIAIQQTSRLAIAAEPLLSAPRVKIRLPDLKRLVSVIEAVNQITDIVSLSANERGDLRVECVDPTLNMQTFFKNLQIDNDRNGDSMINDATAAIFCTARLSVKKLLNVLHCRMVNAAVVLACWVEEGALVIYVKLNEKRGHLTYYIPWIAQE